MDSLPQQQPTPPHPPTDIKTILLSVSILILVGLAGWYIFNSMWSNSTSSSSEVPTPSVLPTIPITTTYDNPFDESTTQTNPFEETTTNPFDAFAE